ncbi:hypothetical protein [Sphingomonas sp. Leaf205]|uniref:hypothetical protein n=1 Tax=Sphingomonas sp. Leaf205 TaxID=2876551 RepID=UPI001E29B38E|nr:hypothetical protein [Sphingomonas sp. Leaf205]
MQMNVFVPNQPLHNALPALCQDDPLDNDKSDDAVIVTTRRGLLRLALVASETASRFVREQVAIDPMAWMLTPRRIFGGRAAIDGCLARDECLRAVVLHGLSMGMDADPAEIDALADDDEDDFSDAFDDADHRDVASPAEQGLRGPRLWTSFLVMQNESGAVQAFDALIAVDRREAEERLRARHGGRLVDEMRIVEGFDPNLPLAEALISPALADMLAQVAADPASPLAEGLSVSVMQRFAA